MEELDLLASRVADLVLGSRKTVVFTGAGVSTESGIPDFRSPGGLWERYDPDEFTIDRFLASPETRRNMWQMLTGEFFHEVKPNPAHHAIARLEKLGRLDCVITQNVDDLHQQAGNSRELVLELHGNMRWALCLSCGTRYPMEHIQERLAAGVAAPDCGQCRGILKPAGVFFGESLPAYELQEAIRRSRACDLFIVIGSTLMVYPAAYMPVYAVEAGAKLVIINLMPTPMDRFATVIIKHKAGEALPRIVDGVAAGLKG